MTKMYKAYDKISCADVMFSHENDAVKAVLDGLIDGYDAIDYIPPEPTLDEVKAVKIAEFTQNIQARLDLFAQTKGYDGILSAASYATSGNVKFAAEGQAAVDMRDETWAKGYELIERYMASGSIPTWEEIEAELPELVWPNAV